MEISFCLLFLLFFLLPLPPYSLQLTKNTSIFLVAERQNDNIKYRASKGTKLIQLNLTEGSYSTCQYLSWGLSVLRYMRYILTQHFYETLKNGALLSQKKVQKQSIIRKKPQEVSSVCPSQKDNLRRYPDAQIFIQYLQNIQVKDHSVQIEHNNKKRCIEEGGRTFPSPVTLPQSLQKWWQMWPTGEQKRTK